MAEKQFLTKKGYDERVARLEELKVVRRKEVAQKLKEAREQGDLSENAEYDTAKDEQTRGSGRRSFRFRPIRSVWFRYFPDAY